MGLLGRGATRYDEEGALVAVTKEGCCRNDAGKGIASAPGVTRIDIKAACIAMANCLLELRALRTKAMSG